MEIENDCYLNMGVLESESDGIYLDQEEKERERRRVVKDGEHTNRTRINQTTVNSTII